MVRLVAEKYLTNHTVKRNLTADDQVSAISRTHPEGLTLEPLSGILNCSGYNGKIFLKNIIFEMSQ